MIEDSGWAELLRSFGTQTSAGIKYCGPGLPENLLKKSLKFDILMKDEDIRISCNTF